MTNADFVRAFHAGNFVPSQFHHRDHLRLTWALVRELGEATATTAITEGIRDFAAQHGQANKYHETMTRFWVRIVGHVCALHPEFSDFDRFIEAFPHLLDKDLPFRHWSRATMLSDAARAAWVEPDLLALPA